MRVTLTGAIGSLRVALTAMPRVTWVAPPWFNHLVSARQSSRHPAARSPQLLSDALGNTLGHGTEHPRDPA